MKWIIYQKFSIPQEKFFTKVLKRQFLLNIWHRQMIKKGPPPCLVFQLLGDYDKVKTFSSGSDCVCRCIVRPMKRADCSHLHDGVAGHEASAKEYYTVETISKGSDCKKCVCLAPPSAINPCDGEYRLKKLQEASKDDIKVGTQHCTSLHKVLDRKNKVKLKNF